MDYRRFWNINSRYMEDFKIYIFLIQKSFLCRLGEISLVYNLHIGGKMWYLFDYFQIQCSVLSMFCRQFWCSTTKRTAGRWKSWRGVLVWPPDPLAQFFKVFLPHLKKSLDTAMLFHDLSIKDQETTTL